MLSSFNPPLKEQFNRVRTPTGFEKFSTHHVFSWFRIQIQSSVTEIMSHLSVLSIPTSPSPRYAWKMCSLSNSHIIWMSFLHIMRFSFHLLQYHKPFVPSLEEPFGRQNYSVNSNGNDLSNKLWRSPNFIWFHHIKNVVLDRSSSFFVKYWDIYWTSCNAV